MKKLLFIGCLIALVSTPQLHAQSALGYSSGNASAVKNVSSSKKSKKAKVKASADMILGVWWSPEMDAKIEIYEEDDKYYGKIVWLDDPSLTDERNEDPELRGRPILGIQLLKDFEYNSRKKEWSHGMVYEPYKGKFYSSYIKVDKKNSNKLKVRGFIMNTRFLGETETFTRVEE